MTEQLTGGDAPCAHLCYCERAANRAEIARLRFALQVARSWMPTAKPEQPHGDIDKAHKIVSDALELRT